MGEEKKENLQSKESLENFFSDLGDEDAIDGEYGAIDQIVDEVMAILENFGPISGGLISFDKLLHFLKTGPRPDMEVDTLAEVISHLRDDKIITYEFEVNEEKSFYCFQPLKFDEDMENFIAPFLKSEKLSKSALYETLGWEEDRFISTLQKFKDQKLIHEENGTLVIPGL